MAILVVGGAGYIGSHTVDLLMKRGYEPVIFDSLELGHRQPVEILGAPFVHGDYGDLAALTGAIRKYKVDSVFHFGAYASVGDSVIDPAKYYESNIGKGVMLLRAALDNGIRHFVFSSSAATYGETDHYPDS